MEKIPVSLPRQSASRQADKRRSSVLVICLWSLCLLASFAVMLSYNVRQKAALVKRLEERARLGLTAQSGVEQAIAVLAEPEKSYDSFLDSWSNNASAFKNIALGDSIFDIGYDYYDWQAGKKEYRYGLIDEERKININKAQGAALERLFIFLLNCEEAEAKDLAYCVIDWRDSDSDLSAPLGGAEDRYYQGLDHPYEAKDADFECLDELLLVKGFDREYFMRIRDYITVWGSGYVNINTADLPVLVALGLDEYTASSVVSFRLGNDGIAGSSDDNIFESTYEVAAKIASFATLSPVQFQQLDYVAGQNLSTKSNYFMVKCKAGLQKRRYSVNIEAIVDRKGKVLYWSQL